MDTIISNWKQVGTAARLHCSNSTINWNLVWQKSYYKHTISNSRYGDCKWITLYDKIVPIIEWYLLLGSSIGSSYKDIYLVTQNIRLLAARIKSSRNDSFLFEKHLMDPLLSVNASFWVIALYGLSAELFMCWCIRVSGQIHFFANMGLLYMSFFWQI